MRVVLNQTKNGLASATDFATNFVPRRRFSRSTVGMRSVVNGPVSWDLPSALPIGPRVQHAPGP